MGRGREIGYVGVRRNGLLRSMFLDRKRDGSCNQDGGRQGTLIGLLDWCKLVLPVSVSCRVWAN